MGSRDYCRDSWNRSKAILAEGKARGRSSQALALVRTYCRRLATAFGAPVEDVAMVDGLAVDEFHAARGAISSAKLFYMFSDPDAGKGPEHFGWGDDYP